MKKKHNKQNVLKKLDWKLFLYNEYKISGILHIPQQINKKNCVTNRLTILIIMCKDD